MSKSRGIYLFGYSGHAYVIIEAAVAAGYSIKGYFDLKQSRNNPFNLEYFGSEKEADVKSIVGDDYVFPAIGDNEIRKSLIRFFESNHLNQCAIVEPSAMLSDSASVGLSTFISKNVAVNALASIGNGVILNTGCIIEHECVIDDFVHMAPSSVLCGNVEIGRGSFIGANSVIRPNTSVSSGVIVGAGSVVVKDITSAGIWYGNPAKLSSKRASEESKIKTQAN